MIGASKILTVSYGTFSCTLEGFDDPFNTMRAIAEYFRDLAAEDRYFGAEPPTPDAAMLLKIAEREVQRRVEAKINDNGVVLRTGDAMEAPAFVPTPQPAPAPTPVVYAPQPASQPAPMPDGVAAKLLRIRAAVASAELAEPRVNAPAELTPAPESPAALQPILTDYTEDQHAEDVSTTNILTATFAPTDFESDETEADDWSAPDAGAPSADYGYEETAAEPTETAAKLLAEASAHTEYDADDAYVEVDLSALIDHLPAEDTPPAVEAPAHTALADDSALSALIRETTTSQVADTVDLDAVDLEIVDLAVVDDVVEALPADYAVSADDLADLRALYGDTAETDDLETIAAIVIAADFDEDEGQDQGAIATQDTAYDDEAEPVADTAITTQLDAQFADELAAEAEAASDPVLEEIDSAYGPDVSSATGPSEKALRARARVIKVRREDAETSLAAPDTAAADVAAMLAADAEADLRRELRALQQKTAEPSAAATVALDDADDLSEEAGPEDDARQRLDPAGEAAVSRLIDQTNEVMAVPENRRRLSAIAHLKAAVAATVAERFTKGDSAPKAAETKRLDTYREDLARVVRPQHPSAGDDAPVTPRPAPLVLVSAQRIDRLRAQPGDTPTNLTAVPNAPVRPRRVTSAVLAVETLPEVEDEDDDVDAVNLFTDARGFAEFSERLGANSLAEILEAAAAYSVCIEGRPYFSRPQLMTQIGALSADSEYTREDGLRTFGALLREGRIQKIKRGQFVLTESSRYLAEARALAG